MLWSKMFCNSVCDKFTILNKISSSMLEFLSRLPYWNKYIGCATRYRTRHFFNNSNTNEDTAKKFEQE